MTQMKPIVIQMAKMEPSITPIAMVTRTYELPMTMSDASQDSDSDNTSVNYDDPGINKKGPLKGLEIPAEEI